MSTALIGLFQLRNYLYRFIFHLKDFLGAALVHLQRANLLVPLINPPWFCMFLLFTLRLTDKCSVLQSPWNIEKCSFLLRWRCGEDRPAG